MNLESITLHGFQSYGRSTTISFDPHLTLIAGRNNVGKSALLRALQVLATPQDGASPDFQLTLTWQVPTADLLSVVAAHNNAVLEEWISTGGDQQALSVSFVTGGATQLSPDHLSCVQLALPSTKATAAGSRGRTMGWDSGPFADSSFAVDDLVRLAKEAAQRITYLAPRRVDQGPRHLTPQAKLAPDARNLTETLYDLYMNQRFGVYQRLESFMQDAFPGLQGITVSSRTDGGSTQALGEPQIHFDKRNDPVPLRLCGTGLEQMLALAIAVMTSQESELILIDEPQAYLHPHAERSMLSLIDEHQEHQFVVASHSHVLLRSRPLRQARLLTLDDGFTVVAHIEEGQEALAELGVTAADLWLADRLLWVEGPSEKVVFDLLAEEVMTSAERSTLAIRSMPDASRFAAKSARQASATFRFCGEIASAIAPLAIQMLFVFDADEKTQEFQERMQTASQQRSVFLPVRELENLFLDSDLLHKAIQEQCQKTDQQPPSKNEVADQLTRLLSLKDERDLYPEGLPDNVEAKERVRASALLRRLWWDFMKAEYDKVQSAAQITRLALSSRSEALQPLVKILDRLRTQTPPEATANSGSN